jgi:hypothetical protein
VWVCVQLKAKTAEFRARLARGETLADVQAGKAADSTVNSSISVLCEFPWVQCATV